MRVEARYIEKVKLESANEKGNKRPRVTDRVETGAPHSPRRSGDN